MYQQNGLWDTSPYLNQSPRALNMDKRDNSATFWKSDSPLIHTPYSYAPYPMTPTTVSFPPSSLKGIEHFKQARTTDEHSWEPSIPVRSISLVNPGDLPAQFQTHYYHNTATDPIRRNTTPTGMRHSTPSSNAIPLEIPFSSSQVAPNAIPYNGHGFHRGMPFTHPPPWSSAPSLQGKRLVTSGPQGYNRGWYGESPGLPQLKEEDPGSHMYHGDQTPTFPQFRPNPG